MNILHIDSSILGDNSVSRALSASTAASLKAAYPDATITYYDLAADPIGHLSGALYAAQAKAEADRTPAEKADVDASAKAMADFKAADILVVAAPMYNFGIPTQLKAWIDRIAVAGETFRYTANGPEGLAGGKTVYVISARGGLYGADTPNAMADHQETYLTSVFGFLGITDVRFVRAEGVAMGPDFRAKAIEQAHSHLASHLQLAA